MNPIIKELLEKLLPELIEALIHIVEKYLEDRDKPEKPEE